MSTLPRIRLQGFIADKANVTVLLRHGPHGLWRMIRWDMERDHFQRGQWFRGTIYLHGCDISPDGSLFVTLMAKHWRWRQSAHVWTILSRPPYFTALAMRAELPFDPRGAIFLDDAPPEREEWKCAPHFALPRTLATRSLTHEGMKAQARASKNRRAAWRHETSYRYVKDGPQRCQLIKTAAPNDFHNLHATLKLDCPDGKCAVIANVDWLDFDHAGNVVFSDHAQLFRIGNNALRRWLTQDEDWSALRTRAKMLADFSDDAFEPIAAPYIGLDYRQPSRNVSPPEPGSPQYRAFLQARTLKKETPVDRLSKEERRAAKRSRARPPRQEREKPNLYRRPLSDR